MSCHHFRRRRVPCPDDVDAGTQSEIPMSTFREPTCFDKTLAAYSRVSKGSRWPPRGLENENVVGYSEAPNEIRTQEPRYFGLAEPGPSNQPNTPYVGYSGAPNLRTQEPRCVDYAVAGPSHQPDIPDYVGYSGAPNLRTQEPRYVDYAVAGPSHQPDIPDYDERQLCYCRPRFPPCSTCVSLGDVPDTTPEVPPSCVILFFILKILFFLLMWLGLLYMYIETSGFYLEPIPISRKPMTYRNTFASFDFSGKNYIIKSSRSSKAMSILLNGPFVSLSSQCHFNYQFERWYFNASDFETRSLERPRWDDEYVRYPQYPMTNHTTPWYIEVVNIKSKRLTYTYSLSHTTIKTWITTYFYTNTDIASSLVALASETRSAKTTSSSRFWAYRIRYSADSMNRLNVRKNGHQRYNFNDFTEDRTVSADFPLYTSVRARNHTKDQILGNGTKDQDIRLIYSFRYCLNTTEDNKKNLRENILRGSTNETNNTTDEALSFSVELIRGFESDYTTTTTTTESELLLDKVDSSQGYNYMCYLMAATGLLLVLQVKPMSIFITAGITGYSAVSYLEGRRPSTLEYMHLEMVYLLYSMLLVVFLADTGIFGYIALRVRVKLRSETHLLMIFLCFAVSFFSIIPSGNNTITMLFMTPVAIRCSEEFDINPVPVLIMMIMYANNAGILTSTSSLTNYGMPPLSENFFSLLFRHVILTIITTIYFVLVFKQYQLYLYPSTKIAALKVDAALWNIIFQSSDSSSGQSIAIRQYLHSKCEFLQEKIASEEARLNQLLLSQDQHWKNSFKGDNCIRDKKLLNKIALSMLIYILFLVLRLGNTCFGRDSIKKKDIYCFGGASSTSLVWLGIGTLFILINPNFNRTMRRVDWATISNFTMLTLLSSIFHQMNVHEYYDMKNKRTEYKSIMWNSSYLSAIMNGISIRSIFMEVLEVAPQTRLMFSIGTNIGGSATLLGTPTAIACANSAFQQGYRIGYFYFLKIALPLTLIQLIIQSVL